MNIRCSKHSQSNLFWKFFRILLGRAYIQKGMCAEGIPELQKRADLNGGIQTGPLAYAYARCGQRAKAQEILNQARARYGKGPSPWARNIARMYVGLGDTDRALRWLEEAFKKRTISLPYLSVWPEFDVLHTDPRFQNLIKSTGLMD